MKTCIAENDARSPDDWFFLLLRFAALSPPPPSSSMQKNFFFLALVRTLAALAARISSRLSASHVDSRALVACERRKERPRGVKGDEAHFLSPFFFRTDDRRLRAAVFFFLHSSLSLFLASKKKHLHK